MKKIFLLFFLVFCDDLQSKIDSLLLLSFIKVMNRWQTYGKKTEPHIHELRDIFYRIYGVCKISWPLEKILLYANETVQLGMQEELDAATRIMVHILDAPAITSIENKIILLNNFSSLSYSVQENIKKERIKKR